MTLVPTLIVFDCDGTLVDSQHLIAESMRFAFLGVGLAAPERPLPRAGTVSVAITGGPAGDAAYHWSYRDGVPGDGGGPLVDGPAEPPPDHSCGRLAATDGRIVAGRTRIVDVC